MLCLNMLIIMFLVVLLRLLSAYLIAGGLFSFPFFPFANHRVPEQEFEKAYMSNPRLKTRVNKFHLRKEAALTNDGDDFVAIRPEWTTVDRILACRLSDGNLFLCLFVC